ncbi:MAG: DUF3267 domain-containing protein [Planctomycetota bacterium]|jgi:hypothetical protein
MSETGEREGTLVAAYSMPRGRAVALAGCVGVGLGIVAAALGLEFIPRRAWDLLFSSRAGLGERALPFLVFLGQLVAALLVTVLLHEGVHGLIAVAFGCRPRFGVKFPLVFVTFDEMVPRGRFILVALGPLVLLDAAFAALVWARLWPGMFLICVMANTIGATGDVWMALKLLPHRRGSLVRDTATGFEVHHP